MPGDRPVIEQLDRCLDLVSSDPQMHAIKIGTEFFLGRLNQKRLERAGLVVSHMKDLASMASGVFLSIKRTPEVFRIGPKSYEVPVECSLFPVEVLLELDFPAPLAISRPRHVRFAKVFPSTQGIVYQEYLIKKRFPDALWGFSLRATKFMYENLDLPDFL